MDVVRGSLREFGSLLSVLTGGLPEIDDTDPGHPHRGAGWIVIQVAALAALAALLFAIAQLFIDVPQADPVATSAAWFLPGFVLALPLAMHWFAVPPRRGAGLLVAVVAGGAVAAAVAPVVTATGWASMWVGLLTLTTGGLAAAAVFGAVAPCPATPDPDSVP